MIGSVDNDAVAETELLRNNSAAQRDHAGSVWQCRTACLKQATSPAAVVGWASNTSVKSHFCDGDDDDDDDGGWRSAEGVFCQSYPRRVHSSR